MSASATRGETLARNSLLNLGGMLLPLLVALGTMPAITRGLGVARLGLLSIAWLLLGVVSEFGAGRATTKFMAEAIGRGDRHRLAPILWTTVAAQVTLGVIVALGLAALAPALAGQLLKVPTELVPEARLSLLLVAGAMPAALLASCLRGVLEAEQRFDLINAVRLPATVANYLLPLVGLALGWHLPGIIALLLVGRVLTAGVFLVLDLALFPELRRWARLDRSAIASVAAFGGWTTVSNVASPLLVYVERFILAGVVGLGAVGYYSVSFELVNRLLVIPGAIAATLFPAFSELQGAGDEREANRITARALKWILCLLGPAVVLLGVGAPDVLSVWLGPQFAREGATALRILALGVAVNALAHVPYVLLQGRGRADLPARFQLLEVPVQIVVAWLLVQHFGVAGAAAAWTFRVTFDAVLLFAAARRVANLSGETLRDARLFRVGALLLIVAAAGAAVSRGPDLPLRLGLAVTAALVATATLWRLALDRTDRSRVLRLLRIGNA